jgi:hypothetical protein
MRWCWHAKLTPLKKFPLGSVDRLIVIYESIVEMVVIMSIFGIYVYIFYFMHVLSS